MKARTINSAVSKENSNRSGQAGANAAPHIDRMSRTNVEATSHQLLPTDSTAYGAVALSNSRPIRTPALLSGGVVLCFGVSIFCSRSATKKRYLILYKRWRWFD